MSEKAARRKLALHVIVQGQFLPPNGRSSKLSKRNAIQNKIGGVGRLSDVACWPVASVDAMKLHVGS
ncbi:hypothetical protein ACVI1J_009758 [Bradyrhizobium diazoefficiens]